MKRKYFYGAAIMAVLVLALIKPLGQGTMQHKEKIEEVEEAKESVQEAIKEEPQAYRYINPQGTTLETRINVPEGYHRTASDKHSLAGFIRNLTLKPDKSPVLLYDGREKGNQSAQAAVFDLDVGDRDLQQCADSIMRIYAEYYFAEGKYDKIQFHLTNGFLMEYSKWRNGSRIKVTGNDVRWVQSASPNKSYESFRRYLDQVYSYAGTISLEKESTAIEIDDLKVGDMFIYGASLGRV